MSRLLIILLSYLIGHQIFAQSGRPNILFILTDDLGYSDLGCYGHVFHETPNLDSLALRGIRFTQAYSSSPVCSPSRAGLITGIHPARLGITNFLVGERKDSMSSIDPPPVWQKFLPADQLTLAEWFRDRHFRTGMIGKWHLGSQEGSTPWHQGFDFSRMIGKNGLDYYNYTIYEDSYEREFTDDGTHYLTDKLTDYVLQFLENGRNSSDPFFLFLSYSAPHVFLVPRADKLSKYYRKYNNFGNKYEPSYAAMIESVDDGVGKIIEKLKNIGQLENTMIIFTSDNGGVGLPELGPIPTDLSPLRKWKGHCYEGGIRIPLIISWPGKPGMGTINHAVTSNLDFFPTFAEMMKENLDFTPDGKSIWPEIVVNSKTRDRELFWHYPHFSNQMGRPSAAIRDGDWKLVYHFENQQRELFNLAKDIAEKDNLFESLPEKGKELTGKLIHWLMETGARLPIVKDSGKSVELYDGEK